MTEIRTLVTGINFGESPRWHDGRLWFSDWMAGDIIAVDPDGGREVVARVPTAPFCFDFGPDGRALVASGGEGALLVREADGTLVPHADLSGLSKYPWNEVTADRRGGAYVNNINFEFPDGEVRPGFVAYVEPGGTAVREVAGDIAFPNGMALTPDGGTLIVAESYAGRLTAFDVAPDGGLSGRRVWADLGDAAPDGICLDADGSVWYADVAHRRCVRVREGGEVLATVEFDRGAFSCALGGVDGRTLFVVGQTWGEPGGEPGAEPSGRLYAVDV
jgi:sugar lactone lactonase YvrE